MFGLRRSQQRNRSELLREELTQTVDHAMKAAGHAADGVSAAVRPRVAAARETMVPVVRDAASRSWESTVSALAPLAEAAQARVGRRQSRRQRVARVVKRRWPALVGLLAGGILAGAAAAAVLRRRSPATPLAEEELLPASDTPAADADTGPAGPAGPRVGPGGADPGGADPEAAPGATTSGPAADSDAVGSTDNRRP